MIRTIPNAVRNDLSLLVLEFTPYFLTGPTVKKAASAQAILGGRWKEVGFQPADEPSQKWLEALAKRTMGEREVTKHLWEV